ncbi:MAG: hypothetical protein LBN09_02880 [Clostridioides sp.]|jgi:HlyD family secretion protein|nr:hypothetical protein [Clostridioides sp.]
MRETKKKIKNGKQKKERKPKKKLTKKQQIRYSIGAGVLALVVIVGAFVYSSNRKEKEASNYTVYKVEKAEPLVFKGNVAAEKTENVFYDATLGKITDIPVSDGFEVKTGERILTYKNEAVQAEAETQDTGAGKLKLAVSNAEENLETAKIKLNKYNTKLADAKYELKNLDKSTVEGKQKAQELKATIAQYEEQASAQADVVTQSRQALKAAKADYKDASNSVESTRKKATKHITAPIDGIVFVNKSGKSDPTTPVIKIVSKDVVVQGKVSEYDYDKLTVLQKVSVRASNQTQEIGGEIKHIDKLPEEEAASSAMPGVASAPSSVANYNFVVKLDNPIQYGYSVQIKVAQNELRIPQTALIKEGTREYVYTYKNGRAIRKAIRTENVDGVIVVKDGLKENEKIIANPDDKLVDGQSLDIKSDESAAGDDEATVSDND